MNSKFPTFPFLTTDKYLALLRILLGFLMMCHGVARIYFNSISSFGEFLESKGFPLGIMLASGITFYDIGGGFLLILGLFKKWISLGFILVLSMGIFLVHLKNGWFVVGHTAGGVEYSVLLIICFLLTSSANNNPNQI